VISHLTILVILVLSLGASPAAAGQNLPTLRALKQAVVAKPQDPQAHYSLGLKYESLGQTKKAIAEYRKSLSLKPGDDKVLYSLGRITAAGGEPGQALTIIQQAVKLNPKSVETRSLLAAVYNQQAMAFLQEGNLDDARESLAAGIQAKGGPAETQTLLNNLGCLYVREGKPDQAVGTWQEILRQNPDMPQAHYNLALVYYTQGDYQAASREFFALKGIDRNMAGELSEYRFRIKTSTEVMPPVKTMMTFKGSPLLTEGGVLPSYSR
jgi:tetratricopeptide (TPR) repeat protein